MKKATQKYLCLMIALILMIGSASVIPVSASAATVSQKNIVSRADWLYDTTWTAKKDVTGWRYTFSKDGTYHIPYSQPVYTNGYIGYGISVDGFLSAADDISSKLYTDSSTYNRTSTYYGMDCSSFVSLCWGVNRQTTYSLPNISSKIGTLSSYIDSAQIGDALNYRDENEQHVILITDLTYTDGKVSGIEITEQTPPQIKRTNYTRAALLNRYGYYIIYRYKGTVPEPPAAYLDPIVEETYYAESSDPSVIRPAVSITNPEAVSSVSFELWDDDSEPVTFEGVYDQNGVWYSDIFADTAELKGTVYCRCRVQGNSRFDEYRDLPEYEINATVRYLGDANGDGSADIVDTAVIQRVATNIYVPYDEAQLMCGDVDGDESLTTVDATFVQRYVNHSPVPYPIGEPIK